ncbi:MAG TPA: ATP-binding protein [Gaiellaceae bacterium]|nr:ATP-binding protein [Gaiellaceae bacterium]
MPATNPFRFGDLAFDESFTDREDELASLASDLRNGQNVALVAPRRYGKTSLLRRVAQTLVGEGVLVAEVDLMKTPTKEKLAGKLARAIHDDVASPLFRARERLRVFSGLRITPTITIDPTDGTPTFSFSATHRREDLDATLERLLELPAQLAAERGRNVAIVFDEFQEVTEIDPRLPALMRAVFQEQPHVAHVYAGSRRDMMHRLFTDANEPFFRSAKVMELGRIEPALFAAFVEEQFERTDRSLAAGVAARLVAITRGHPYGTQELAYALWELVPEGFSASPDDLARAIEAVVRSENAHFTLAWDGASRTQRLVLQALAAEPGRVYGADYRARHDLPAASSVQRAVEQLVADELVERGDAGFEIAEPFLREWVLAMAS